MSLPLPDGYFPEIVLSDVERRELRDLGESLIPKLVAMTEQSDVGFPLFLWERDA